MTRLFVRFYLGVMLILFVAWLIQAYVIRGSTEAENIVVVETALGGAAFYARDDIIEGGEANFEESIARVRSRFAYPVNLVRRSQRQMTQDMLARIDRGEAVLNRSRIDVAIPDSDLLVELGPLPQFAGPRRSDVLLGLGSVILLAAVAIAILMRPIAKQFRTVEGAAMAIAGGDFSARIDKGQRNRGLPIVDAFNTMAARVETLLRSQKELLQAVSHELRTPLARIKFAIELVRSAEDNEKRQQRLDAIDEATDKLDDLVGELLDYARLDEGTEAAQHEAVFVNDVVVEAVGIYAPLYPNIKFDITEESLPVSLTTYRAGLLRAIGNLISNAGKYAESRVNITVTEQDDRAVISVDDDGIGIAPSDRELVFEPFKRLAGNAHPGTGLGLALVRRICQRLQGDVTVNSSSLGGARFQLRFLRKAQS